MSKEIPYHDKDLESPQAAIIKDERDYAIRKGRVLEKFTQEFFNRHKHNPIYKHVYESLIRDADPYDIIEKLIEINAEQYQLFQEVMPYVSPNYHLNKNK
jgi:hypothetical protein